MYNIRMVKRGGAKSTSGFTIIEVMLSLAISGMVLVGALIGVSSTISRQRYRDVVENTASLLRTQYDLVSRIQIEKRNNDDDCDKIMQNISFEPNGKLGRGRSNCSVYGVVVTLGLNGGTRMQVNNLIGMDYDAYRKTLEDPDEVIKDMSELDLFKTLSVTNVLNDGSVCRVTNLLYDETYKWDATLETTVNNQSAEYIIMIARSPRSGAIHTYTYNYSAEVGLDSFDYTDIASGPCSSTQGGVRKATLKDAFDNNKFVMNEDVKLCINSADMLATYGKRRMIKITANGYNSSAVALMNMDDSGNECQ